MQNYNSLSTKDDETEVPEETEVAIDLEAPPSMTSSELPHS
jgi:hypothetical protein